MPVEMTTCIVRNVRSGSKPCIPIESSRGSAVWFGLPPGPAQHVVNFDMDDSPEFSAGDVIARRLRIGAASVLETNLNNAIILASRLNHLAPFPDAHGWVFLHINILAGLTGPDCRQCMPVLRSCHHDRLDFIVIQSHSHIRDPLRWPLLSLSQLFHDSRPAILPDVTDIFELHARQARHSRGVAGTSPTCADQGQYHLFGSILRVRHLGSSEQRRTRADCESGFTSARHETAPGNIFFGHNKSWCRACRNVNELFIFIACILGFAYLVFFIIWTMNKLIHVFQKHTGISIYNADGS